jgi:predicted nucleotide-binding protein
MDRLDLSGRQVDRLISERGRELVVTREQAALALALEAGLSINRYAEDEDIAVLRGAIRAQTPEAPVAEPGPPRSPQKRAGRRKTTATRRPRPRRRTGKRVAVVHGRDTGVRRSMFQFLRALKLDPIEWSQAVRATGQGTPYIGEVLDKAFEEATAVVVLLTPDDVARLKPNLRKQSDPPYEATLTGQARPNVLFEAGMAFGRHPRNTILVEVGDLRPFSDIGGRHTVRLSNRAEDRQELADRLATAGCEVDTTGTDWLSEGDFSA